MINQESKLEFIESVEAESFGSTRDKEGLFLKEISDTFEACEKSFKDNSEVVEQLKSILICIREEIDSHQIVCVLGDDKSARVPTLGLGKTINDIYSSKGEERVPLLFIDPHNYTSARGAYGFRAMSYGEKSEERLDILKSKVKLFLERSKLTKGTILLVTDFIDTGSTTDTFELIAKENNFDIRVVNNPDWHASKKNDSGLVRNDDPLSIHAKSLFVNIDNSEDVEKQLDILKDSGFWNRTSLVLLRMAIAEMKLKVDNTLPINSSFVPSLLNTHSLYVFSDECEDIKESSIRNFIIDTLTLDQQKTLLSLLRKWAVVVPRDNINDASKKLTEWFVHPQNKN